MGGSIAGRDIPDVRLYESDQLVLVCVFPGDFP